MLLHICLSTLCGIDVFVHTEVLPPLYGHLLFVSVFNMKSTTQIFVLNIRDKVVFHIFYISK